MREITKETPPEQMSPHMLMQERIRGHVKEYPWSMLVCCVMLNQSGGLQVLKVIDKFFHEWPTPGKAATADPVDMAAVLKPIGFQNVKSKRIIKMSAAYGTAIDNIAALPGVGKYALESWRIFVDDDIDFDPTDHRLALYVEWAKGEVDG